MQPLVEMCRLLDERGLFGDLGTPPTAPGDPYTPRERAERVSRILDRMRREAKAPTLPRIQFDDQALTVTIDGGASDTVENPKAYKLFRTIAEAAPGIVNTADINSAVPGTNGRGDSSAAGIATPAAARRDQERSQGLLASTPAGKKVRT